MFRQVYLLDLNTQKFEQITNVPGKLGNYSFSPDGKNLAYTAARNRKDHAVSQAFVMSLTQQKPVTLTPMDFRGHTNWVEWKDNKTLYTFAAEGVETVLYSVDLKGEKRKKLLHSQDVGFVFRHPEFQLQDVGW